jgi:hypothetical protein
VTSESDSKKITIVEKTTHMHVLEAKQGFLFNGSLFHAGLPPNHKWCDQDNTNHELQRILLRMSLHTFEGNFKEAAFDRICTIQKLNRICRLHFLIFGKNSKIKHVENAVATVTMEHMNPET